MGGAALARFLEKKGIDPGALPSTSKLGKIFRRQGVRTSSELQRILALPRRDAPGDEIEELIDLMTEAYRTPAGTMRLRPVQAWALSELHDWRGLFGAIGVGHGKTLITLLSPLVVDASRPVLILPASLRDKTLRDRDVLEKHWRIPSVDILTYESLSRVSGAEELDRIAPDLVILDEAHMAKNLQAAVTRRIRRYVDRRSPMCAIVTGTITSKSLRDYAHLLVWALRDLAPVPRDFGVLAEWCAALDHSSDFPLAPGALMALCNDDERQLPELDAARAGFQRRLVETPGVVATESSDCDASLTITKTGIERTPAIDAALHKLATAWELPDGTPLSNAPVVWAHARQLALGFYYRFKVRPPTEWLDAKRAWSRFVRDKLAHNRRAFDSELQIWNACERGEYDSPEWRAWEALHDTFECKTEAVWICDSVVRACARWLTKPGIAWTEHTAFGRELARVAGVPYFGQGGRSDGGLTIQTQPVAPIVASQQSSGKGLNLQRWDRNLVVSPPASGLIWEQLLGRTHRSGQKSDVVTFDVLVLCEEHEDSLEEAQESASYIETTTGQKQKLLIADKLEGGIL